MSKSKEPKGKPSKKVAKKPAVSAAKAPRDVMAEILANPPPLRTVLAVVAYYVEEFAKHASKKK